MVPRSRWLFRALALLAVASPLVGPLHSTEAPASVSVAATWDTLMHQSSAAAVVTAAESRSVWEDGRIYTYTRVHVDRPVAGDVGTSADAWVRTMGGIVGKVGQIVEGEAAFAPGDVSLLFLRAGPAGSYVVTARGQGQFPVVKDEAQAPAHIVRSQAVGMLVPPRPEGRRPDSTCQTNAGQTARLAADVLHGRPVEDVAQQIAAEWGAAHAR
jgi:hypothetical protein